MGFGHRVYKNYDPRAKIMQKTVHEVLAETGHGDDPMLKVALELERIALQRRLFHREEALSERRLLFGHHAEGDGLPDLDVHRAVRGRPHRRLDRQWKEMIEDPHQKIGRPRQLYTGVARRDYVDDRQAQVSRRFADDENPPDRSGGCEDASRAVASAVIALTRCAHWRLQQDPPRLRASAIAFAEAMSSGDAFAHATRWSQRSRCADTDSRRADMIDSPRPDHRAASAR